MVNNVPRPPTPVNEPVLGYLPGSPERAALKKELDRQSSEVIEIPCIINGKEVFTGDVVEQVMPHDHSHVIARVHMATKALSLIHISDPRDLSTSRMPSSA